MGPITRVLIASSNLKTTRFLDAANPNSAFVGQSGTFPKTFSDYRPEDSKELSSRTNELLEQALVQELGIPVTPATALQWRHLGSLGSHDLSATTEALGMPTTVLGASLCATKGPPFWRYILSPKYVSLLRSLLTLMIL